MSDVAQYTVRDGVAVITMNNPPVNGLGNALRAGLMERLKKAESDPAVTGVVLIGAGKAFSGGADIREFGKPREKPDLFEVNDQQDAMKKPLIAAISGFALGGGLELALGCHYRLAEPKAQLGLPEVKLGILPGSGGTQRLPRIVPMAEALRMMTTGNPISAQRAKDLGLVDEVVSGDLLQAALQFAQRKPPVRRIREMPAKLEGDVEAFFAKARDQVAAESRGYPAPLEIVACAAAAASLPFDEGRKIERERFARLVASAESKALRHMFFAERQTSKIPDVPEDTQVRPIRKAAVIGAGTMGGGIAAHCANAGLPVVLLDVAPSELTAEEQARGLALDSKPDHVADRHADLGRPAAVPVLGPRDRHEPARRLDDRVIARPVGIGAVRAVSGDREVDQARVEPLELHVVEPEPCEPADAEILDHDVGPAEQPPQDFLAFTRAKVHPHAALVAVHREEVGRGLRPGLVRADPRRSPRAGGISLGRLDLDDVRSKIAKEHRAQRPGEDRRAVGDQQAGERSGRLGCVHGWHRRDRSVRG
jgi:enoyl-CoA hydratase/carnithine racemase